MATYDSFKELPGWQKAMHLALSVFRLTSSATFNKEFELKRQINRSAISVPSNIAEGFEHGSKKEFIQFLYIAKGSCGELYSQVLLAEGVGFITEKASCETRDSISSLSGQIGGFIQYLKSSEHAGLKYKNPKC
jgi:four helix bundle protein